MCWLYLSSFIFSSKLYRVIFEFQPVIDLYKLFMYGRSYVFFCFHVFIASLIFTSKLYVLFPIKYRINTSVLLYLVTEWSFLLLLRNLTTPQNSCFIYVYV